MTPRVFFASALCAVLTSAGCAAVDEARQFTERKYKDAVDEYCEQTDPAEQERRRSWSDEVTDPHEVRINCG